VKLHEEPVLFAASVGVQVTVVTPLAKLLPEAGTQVTVAPAQLSDAVGAVNVTAAAQLSVAVLTAMLAGQAESVGAVESTT